MAEPVPPTPTAASAPPGELAPLVLSVMTSPDAGFVERIEAAAAAGYSGVGLRTGDRRRAHEAGLTDADLRAVMVANGVSLVEVEGLHRWGIGGADGEAALQHEARLYELVDALGGRHITATGDLDLPHEEVVERFAALCDRAAEHGLSVALEFLPWTEVPDAGAAWRIVRDAGRPNGGVLVDSWHHFRGAADDDLLRAVPPDRILAVQFDDADAEVVGTPLEDTLHRCRLPGEGAFDLVGFLRLLTAHGVRAPLCVEVISDDLAALPIAEAARLTADATRAVLARAAAAEATVGEGLVG